MFWVLIWRPNCSWQFSLAHFRASTPFLLKLICSDAQQIPAGFGGTLVVLPVSLLAQWEQEIASKAPNLKMFTYHRDNVDEFHFEYRTNVDQSAELSKFDVVLTTYSSFGS